MQILFISPWFAFPPTNGSELRINALLHGLAAEHDVSLISFQRRPERGQGLLQARAVCRHVELIPWREFDPRSRRAIAGFLSSKPRSVVDTYSLLMAQTIRRYVSSGEYDLVIASQTVAAAYASEFGALPAVLEEVEVGALAQGTQAGRNVYQRFRHQGMWRKYRAYLGSLIPRFEVCTVVSEEEAELIRRLVPDYDAVEILPNCLNLMDYTVNSVPKCENSLIFTGAFTYSVNYEAMIWFMSEVYPLVRERIPTLKVTVTGDHGGLRLPHGDEIMLTGFVDDVKSVVSEASVSIVPLWHGGGTRLKVLESMALGTPVVSTAKGSEGLRTVDGEHLLLANSPDAFATAIITLLTNGDLRRRLAINARALVERQYDWQGAMPRFLEIVERAARRSPSTI